MSQDTFGAWVAARFEVLLVERDPTVRPHMYVLTIRERPGWLARLFGARGRVRIFAGNAGRWIERPSMSPVPMRMDDILTHLVAREQWRFINIERPIA